MPDVKGVWCANEGGIGGTPGFFVVVAIKQRYPGHAKQAGMIASGCWSGRTLADTSWLWTKI